MDEHEWWGGCEYSKDYNKQLSLRRQWETHGYIFVMGSWKDGRNNGIPNVEFGFEIGAQKRIVAWKIKNQKSKTISRNATIRGMEETQQWETRVPHGKLQQERRNRSSRIFEAKHIMAWKKWNGSTKNQLPQAMVWNEKMGVNQGTMGGNIF